MQSTVQEKVARAERANEMFRKLGRRAVVDVEAVRREAESHDALMNSPATHADIVTLSEQIQVLADIVRFNVFR